MDEQIRQVLNEILTIDFMEGIFSNSMKTEEIQKVKIRPLLLKDQLKFQTTSYIGKQVFHKNMSKNELIEACEKWFSKEDLYFKQLQLKTRNEEITGLISKKGKVTLKRKKKKGKELEFKMDLSHNRVKKYILEEGKVVPFLVDLGVMTKEGKIVQSRYDKFRQINRFLEFIEDILPELAKDREVTILDFGCGKSYLTFAMYYYLNQLKNYNVRIIGLDLKKDVIRNCNELSKKYGYEKLLFLEGDIASYEGVDAVDMVVTLHACDTATDYALYKAIKWGARVILSVPCCQHEMNKTLHIEGMESITQYGLIKERTAALFTDAMRANLLESRGYKTQILEFIDMEHTPKNILIRGVKQSKQTFLPEKWEEYENVAKMLHSDITLGKLLREED
ncbi:MAG: SAM-dependent methyltransferase [Lachnospiraceae bacterium]|nr:SAM-dependent methyltransferase [Lachnospiraceae bacterium]